MEKKGGGLKKKSKSKGERRQDGKKVRGTRRKNGCWNEGHEKERVMERKMDKEDGGGECSEKWGVRKRMIDRDWWYFSSYYNTEAEFRRRWIVHPLYETRIKNGLSRKECRKEEE